MQRGRLSPENSKVQNVRTACGSGRLMMTYELPINQPLPQVALTRKAKAPTSPKVGAITLQSQFSQGESMNEEILKSSRTSRVAETLQ
jgi:hypothetical protein